MLYRRLTSEEARTALRTRSPEHLDTNGAAFFYPDNSINRGHVETMWQQAIKQAPIVSRTLPVAFGRQIEVPNSAGNVARFHFEDLCARNLGSADYMAVAREFHTVFMDGIPPMSLQVRSVSPFLRTYRSGKSKQCLFFLYKMICI